MGRGFNHVITISERLSKETGIVLDRTSLVKSRDTEPQVGLSRARILVNFKNAFKVSCAENISNKRILIVDDVSTTGATVSETAKVVRKAGAAYIAVMVLALRSK